MTSNAKTPAEIIADNYRCLVEQVANACERAQRDSAEVTIVGVSKYVGAASTRLLVEAGCRDLGESRPQSLASKAHDPVLRDQHIEWHLIGHLQRNKVDIVVETGALIHSVDSERLLRAIDAVAAKRARIARVLIEVNCSGDAEKDGVTAASLPVLLDVASDCPHVEARGLMTMSAREADESVVRQNFAALRNLLAIAQQSHPQLPLSQLSMGMSGDFALAISEGATIVRVGSLLWEGL